MPVNLLSMVGNWIATHLVVLSLLGFVFTGFHVIRQADPSAVEAPDVGPAPDGPGVTAVEGATTGNRVEHALPSESVKAEAVTSPGSLQDGMSVQQSASNPTGPRLIGGSLPVYGQQGVPASASAPSPTPGPGGAFRPPVEIPAPAEMSRDDHLQSARRAFWNGDFEAAESAYMTLISAYPADADAFGELGNLYQSMGEPDRALDAYYEAAVRLKAAGDGEKAIEIIELLRERGDQRIDQLDP